MPRFGRHLTALTVCVFTLASACTENRVLTLPPVPAELFDDAAPIAISSTSAVIDRLGHVVAGAGEGAATGALTGGGGSILGGAYTGNPLGLAAGIVLAPVFMLGGGIAGGIAAHPAEETKAAIAAIEAVYADKELIQNLPAEVSRQLETAELVSGPPCPDDGPVSKPCIGPGANQLRMTVNYGFSTEGQYTPDLTFGVDVEAVGGPPDASGEGMRYRWGYVSPQLDFFQATANDAASLRRELRAAQKRLAGRIAEDLVLNRSELRVAGEYYGYMRTPRFIPEPLERGVAARLPLQTDLVNASEAHFSP